MSSASGQVQGKVRGGNIDLSTERGKYPKVEWELPILVSEKEKTEMGNKHEGSTYGLGWEGEQGIMGGECLLRGARRVLLIPYWGKETGMLKTEIGRSKAVNSL